MSGTSRLSGITPSDVVRGGLARLRRPLDAYYSSQHPRSLARTLIRAASPLANLTHANDKWTLPAHLRQWMPAALAPPLHPLPPPKRILLHASYRGEFTLNLVLAALMAWRGHRVTVGYLPRLGSPLKPPWTDDPTAVDYLRDSLGEVAELTKGRVTAEDMSAWHDADAPIDEGFIERQVWSDTVMRMATETLDPADPEVSWTLDHYRKLGRAAHRCVAGYLSARRHAFDLAAIGNGMTFASAHIVHIARQMGLDVVTFEKFAFRRVRVVTHGDAVFSFKDLDLLWAGRKEMDLLEGDKRAQAIAKAKGLLAERRAASVRNFAWQYQSAAGQVADESVRRAGLQPGEDFALVCPNVPFDAGYYQFCTIFSSMREWLSEAVRALLDNTDLKVVVRSHPGEVLHYGGREKAADILAQAGLAGHPRLHVVAPNAEVNTFGLMERCKFGAVFSSTTGIEMAMLGKRVIVGADVYYSRRGFTVDCADRAAYLEAIRSASREQVSSDEAQRISEEASLFYYFVHFVWQQPYPYDKAIDILRLPPTRLVRSAAVERYLPLIDSLAMARDEFTTCLKAAPGWVGMAPSQPVPLSALRSSRVTS